MKSIEGDPKDEGRATRRTIRPTHLRMRQVVRVMQVSFPAPKGYVYTLEILLAVTVIFVSMVFLLRTPPPKPDFETSIIKRQAFESLEFLDNIGKLKSQADGGNETRIEQDLAGVIPQVMFYETEVCKKSCSTFNVPGNETVVSADYYAGAYRDTFVGKKVKIWAWKKF